MQDLEDPSLWIDTNMYSSSESAFTFLPRMKQCLFILSIFSVIVEILWHLYDSRNIKLKLVIWLIISTIYWTSATLVFKKWANRHRKVKWFAQSFMIGQRLLVYSEVIDGCSQLFAISTNIYMYFILYYAVLCYSIHFWKWVMALRRSKCCPDVI